MTNPATPDNNGPADQDVQPRFDVVPGSPQQPALVRAAGDIDLTSAALLEAALADAAATADEITADMTAVTYCDSAAIRALFATAGRARLTLLVPADGPITTMLTITGLDQIATVITAD